MAAFFQSRRLLCAQSCGVASGMFVSCGAGCLTDATWEQLEEFRSHYPDFQLEDELFAQAGRDVMVGKTFGRRPRRG
jgi:transcriptional regulator GlxA family with amidase domain